MGSTPRKGWMKREWARYPIGTKVRCEENKHLLFSDISGVVSGYGISKDTYPVLHIQLLEDFRKGAIFYPAGEEILGQPLSWWTPQRG